MYAYASIALAQAHAVLTVPVQALDRGEDATTVLVAAHGVLERRRVRLGLEAPDRVEIADGVNEHDMVVIGSRSQLRAGASVNVKVDAGGAAEGHR
jgi:multidrug efflux pump subunit AcrA (membrane-fusion protein)